MFESGSRTRIAAPPACQSTPGRTMIMSMIITCSKTGAGIITVDVQSGSHGGTS